VTRRAIAGGVAALAVLALLQALAQAPGGSPPPVAETAFASHEAEVMSTTVRVTLPRSPDAARHAEAVFEVFRRVDARMSEWKESSPLSAVNREAGRRPVPVPDDLRAVVGRGIEIGEMTGGAFDLTWAALWGLWDFRSPEPRVPADEEIAGRTARVDFRRVAVDDEAGTVFLPEAGMRIGLGGIAKGHALDRAVEVLEARGVGSFMIEGGGQVVTRGAKGDRPWRIGIRDPRGARDDVFAVLDVADASVSSSGDYESFFIQDGVRYHHILDPRTGRPSRGVWGVTVMSRDATLADALSTAFMVREPAESLALAESLPGVEAVLVTEGGEVLTSPGVRGRLQWRHEPHGSIAAPRAALSHPLD
jgi:thiamine biosynthesis lipoprotein